jgi:imidazolonepropionase
LVLPCWCDSHTHLVYARSREEEFVDHINGLSYEEIAERGGGILNSARRVAEMSEDELYAGAMERLSENIGQGTGAIEIKSGYGLSVESELKMLRVVKRMKKNAAVPIKATFLGAHAYPLEFRGDHQGYIHLLINDMLPKIADEGLADYIDCFCEKGFFSVEECAVILEAGARYGLRPKIHVNQLSNSGGVQLGIAHGALSVDHLEEMSDAEIQLLATNNTIATVLPSCSFFLNIPFAPARELIDAGAALAIASDHNPGSTPSGNGQFLLSLACIKYRLTPSEAINALTINGAHAMELQDEAGVIAPGRPSRLIVTRPVPSLAYLPYAFGSDLIEKVVIPNKVLDKT